jgi:uncharacterized protein (TIGR01777 family)
MHVTVTGGTGLVGTRLRERLEDRGDEVTVASRTPGGDDTIVWDPKTPGSLALSESTDAVVHLAGAPIVGKRWNEEYKKELRESRVQGTRTVVHAVRDHGDVEHLVSASAVGYYGDRGDETLTEEAAPADGFLAEICRDWEAEARKLEGDEALETDPALLRTGVVLDPDEGALAQMLNPFWFVKPFHWGLGGRVGDGQQWFPWIHVEDEVRAILHVLDERLGGPFNLAAPNPVRNAAFTKALGSVLGRPTKLPIPRLALKLLYGESASVLFASQRVIPERLEASGFTFEHPDVEEALADLLA